MSFVVIVTGAPGAGKTTLGRSLSTALTVPLFSVDVVKEALFDVLGVHDRPWARQLRDASLEVVARLLADCPTGGIVDVWFDPAGDRTALEPVVRHAAKVVEVLCVVPAEVAASRYASRIRHPGHLPADTATLERVRSAAEATTPLGLGPHLAVDCAGSVDLDGVVHWIRARTDHGTR